MPRSARASIEKRPSPEQGHGREPPVAQERFGARLVAAGTITPDQLRIALHEQRQSGGLLGETLARLEFLPEPLLAAILAEESGLELLDLEGLTPDPALLAAFPRALAEQRRALPLAQDGATLRVVLADPYDVVALDDLRRHFSRRLVLAPGVASATAIRALIARAYSAAAPLDSILQEIETGEAAKAAVVDREAYEHPVVRLANELLQEAVALGASDVHLEPESSFVRVRYRVDGLLRRARALHLGHWPALSHRLKIMAGMNIADTRRVQDGRFQIQSRDGPVDCRVATMPSVWGETIVVRLLDHRRALLPLAELGFDAEALQRLDRIMERPEGIILVTGPTGSGKTTTLYAALRRVSSEEVSVATLEEPVEYQIGLIRQTSVQEAQGLGFAAGVRGVLRMDPDIIFIGEIRDGDTARMALRAAMTGHQVWSTLHCNDALGALPRLVDLGLHPGMIAGHVGGVVAQRLVRKLCPACKTFHPATPEECALLRADPVAPPVIAEAGGCAACGGTGVRGRTALAEVLVLSPALDALIADGAGRAALRRQARAEGLRSLQEDGIARVRRGEIGLAALRRAVDMTSPPPEAL